MYILTLIFILIGCSRSKPNLDNNSYKARITKPNLELISKLSDKENLKNFLLKVFSNFEEIRGWYDEENRDIFMVILNNENL